MEFRTVLTLNQTNVQNGAWNNPKCCMLTVAHRKVLHHKNFTHLCQEEIELQMNGILTLVTWNHRSHPLDHTEDRTWKQQDKLCIGRGMHTSKPAHSSTSVFSHISPGIPTPSSGARNDLVRFLLINAYLRCNKTRGCTEGNMRHLKQWN